jgi:hypothetical protein
MFEKLFKKKLSPSQTETESKESILESVSNTKNYPKEVLAIHNEFHIAAELLLNDAKATIAEASTKDVSKVNRLEKLGFKQANQVTELKPLIQKAALSKEQIGLLNYYQVNYPNNKFITEEQVMAICHKWNLVCGEVGRYKGFVPEKNLRDIEKFSLNPNDKKKLLFSVTRSDEKIKLPFDTIDDSFLTADHVDYFLNRASIDFGYITSANGMVERGSFNDKCNVFSGIAYVKATVIKQSELQICAPIKDMDINGLELKDGYKLIKHVPDPVILQRVRGGYLIITAWGDEASDELVVNQQMN